MVNTTGVFAGLLLFQNVQESDRFLFSLVGTLRLFCIFGNISSLAGKKRSIYTSLGAVLFPEPFGSANTRTIGFLIDIFFHSIFILNISF